MWLGANREISIMPIKQHHEPAISTWTDHHSEFPRTLDSATLIQWARRERSHHIRRLIHAGAARLVGRSY